VAQKAMVGYGLAMILIGAQSYFFPTGKPSIVSLIAAGSIGLIVALLGFFASKAENPRWFYIAGIFFAFVGCSRFIGNIFSGKFTMYPGGLVIVLSLGLIALLGLGHVSAMRKRKLESAE